MAQEIPAAAAALRGAAERLQHLRFLIGFDGFVDEIIHAVAKRQDKDHFERVGTIADFGARISSAAGKSANIELVPVAEKMGGNGPLMAQGVAGMGARVTCIGLLGFPEPLPVFKLLQQTAELVTVGLPGHTDALEFLDGKLMLGKLNTLKEMSWSRLVEVLGEEKIASLLAASDLVACTNWTMLTEMEGILDGLLGLVSRAAPTHRTSPPVEPTGRPVPPAGNTGSGQPAARKPLFFFDLADPEKRDPLDIGKALRQIQALDQKTGSVLGLNFREAEQIAALLGIGETLVDSALGVEKAALLLRAKLGITAVVVHAVKHAGAAREGEAAGIDGPFCPAPKLSTGAGDHFNGGFCAALLAGLSLRDALYAGVGTSGWYVRNAKSPRLPDVVELLETWGAGRLKD